MSSVFAHLIQNPQKKLYKIICFLRKVCRTRWHNIYRRLFCSTGSARSVQNTQFLYRNFAQAVAPKQMHVVRAVNTWQFLQQLPATLRQEMHILEYEERRYGGWHPSNYLHRKNNAKEWRKQHGWTISTKCSMSKKWSPSNNGINSQIWSQSESHPPPKAKTGTWSCNYVLHYFPLLKHIDFFVIIIYNLVMMIQRKEKGTHIWTFIAFERN